MTSTPGARIRRNTSRARGLRNIFVIVLGLVLSAQIIRTRLAEALASGGRYSAAYQLHPGDSSIAGRFSRVLLARSAPRSFVTYVANQAVSRSPLAADAVGTLALVEKGSPRGEQMLQAALRLSRRDPDIQLLALERAQARGDAKAVVEHLDNAATIELVSPRIRRSLDAALADPDVAPLLMRRAALHPVWRNDYVLGRSGETDDFSLRLRFLLGAWPDDVSRQESARKLAIFASSRVSYPTIYAIWSQACKTHKGNWIVRSFDPADAETCNNPFGWEVRPVSGADMWLEEHGTSPSMAVRVSGTAVGTVLSQVVSLTEGSHGLQADVQALPTVDMNAFRLSLSCISARKETSTELAGAYAHDGHVRIDFFVPQACPVQLVAFSLAPTDQAMPFEAHILPLKVR